MPDPSKIFINAALLFGVLAPGAIAVFLLRPLAEAHGVAAAWPDGVLGWSAIAICAFVLGYLAQPPSHGLNWLYDRTYRNWRRRDGDPGLERVRERIAAELGPNDSVYAYAKSAVARVSPKQGQVIDTIEGISKGFRTIAFIAVIGTAITAIDRRWDLVGWVVLLFVLSFLVFAERRFAATREVYQSYLALFPVPAPAAAAEPAPSMRNSAASEGSRPI